MVNLDTVSQVPKSVMKTDAWMVVARVKIYAYTKIWKRREDERNPTGYPPRSDPVDVLEVDPVCLGWYPAKAPNQVL